MRGTLILGVALAVGVAVALGLRAALDSTGVAFAAGVVMAWIVWGEASDRLGGGREREPREGPALLDPVRRRRIIGAAAFALAVIFVIGEFVLGGLDADDIREWGEGLGLWGPVILIVILAAAMVFAPIPNPPFMIAAGLIWGTAMGIVYAVIGQVIGAAIIFWISRRFGRGFIPRLVGERGAERIDALAREIGPQLVFWWRMMPISFDFAAYAAGLTPMSFRSFIALVLLGSIAPTAVVVHFGDSLTHSWTARFVAAGLIIVAIVTPATILYWRYRRRLPPPREMLRTLAEWASS